MYTQFLMRPARDPKQCFIETFGEGFRRDLEGNSQTSEKHLSTKSVLKSRKRRSFKYNMTEFEQ